MEVKNHLNQGSSSRIIEGQQVIIMQTTTQTNNSMTNSRLEEDKDSIMDHLPLGMVEDFHFSHLAFKMLRIFSKNSLELICKKFKFFSEIFNIFEIILAHLFIYFWVFIGLKRSKFLQYAWVR